MGGCLRLPEAVKVAPSDLAYRGAQAQETPLGHILVPSLSVGGTLVDQSVNESSGKWVLTAYLSSRLVAIYPILFLQNLAGDLFGTVT